MSQRQISAKVEVLQRATLEERFVHAAMAITELNVGTWREPISQPALLASAPPSDPAADEVAIVGVAGMVALVPVERAWTEMRRHVHVVGDALKAQIEFRNLRNVGKINSGIDGRPIR